MNEMFVIFLILLVIAGNATCFWMGVKAGSGGSLIEKEKPAEIIPFNEDIEYASDEGEIT